MLYKLIINFEKLNTRKNKSYFKGIFIIFFDESSEVIDVKVKFEIVNLDIMSTKRIFKEKTTWWRFKDEFLKQINKIHIERPKGNNNIIILNESQLKLLNNKYNNWRYKGKRLTIKQIDGVISGSNSTGELKYPQRTAFSFKNNKFKNFATFISILWNPFLKYEIKDFFFIKNLKNIEDFFKEFVWLEEIFKSFQKSVSNQKFDYLKKKIKEKTKFSKYNIFLKEINKKILILRDKFRKNMEKTWKKQFNISYKEKKNSEFRNFECAHIKPVSHIKREIFSKYNFYKNNKEKLIDKLEEISDINNGIFLDPNDHKDFDNGLSFINKNFNFITNKKEVFKLNDVYKKENIKKYIEYHRKKIYKKK